MATAGQEDAVFVDLCVVRAARWPSLFVRVGSRPFRIYLVLAWLVNLARGWTSAVHCYRCVNGQRTEGLSFTHKW